MKTLVIKKNFQDDSITRQAGEKLRLLILAAFKKGTAIQLDFAGTIIASTSFFDEGIAKLAWENIDADFLNENLKIINLYKKDKEILQKICVQRGLKFKLGDL